MAISTDLVYAVVLMHAASKARQPDAVPPERKAEDEKHQTLQGTAISHAQTRAALVKMGFRSFGECMVEDRQQRPPATSTGGRTPALAARSRADPLYQLAASVLAGETTEFPWALLRSIYFTAKWDTTAARDLAQWAGDYGIQVSTEQREAGPYTSETWVRFNVPARRTV